MMAIKIVKIDLVLSICLDKRKRKLKFYKMYIDKIVII